MNYYYNCFNRIIKLNLEKEKTTLLDFWLNRFCPNIEILNEERKFDACIECYNNQEVNYAVDGDTIKLYGIFENYESFLAKFITQVFQKLLIKDKIIIVPAACVANNSDCLLITGDFWQGKTSAALNFVNKYNLNLISDNYVAIKDSIVIGATNYISRREEDFNKKEVILKVNNRYFYHNPFSKNIDNLKVKGFLLPFINNGDNNIHYISKEESRWYLYQKFIRLLSGETILFNSTLPSPIFLDKDSSLIILNIVNDLMDKLDLLYISSSIDKIVDEGMTFFSKEV